MSLKLITGITSHVLTDICVTIFLIISFAKVSEVIFINTLNAPALAEQLQKKLSEVEARILAASQRREERLAVISIQQK